MGGGTPLEALGWGCLLEIVCPMLGEAIVLLYSNSGLVKDLRNLIVGQLWETPVCFETFTNSGLVKNMWNLSAGWLALKNALFASTRSLMLMGES